ncbi:PspA/IM30 family protein [Salinirubrum litoreum]|uniref:PspA/IM30 family protein n=1 Tax=Salinirubrum litoreum TaxID=1126234 RepID=A0ABD5RAH0_9EURY|nr:PspA/IM30 family protein [Salinirubrum litoreum]
MGILDRTSDLFGAKMNSLLDRLEDPDEQLDYTYERLQDELSKVESALTDLVTEKKRLEARRDDVESRVADRNEQAREAVAAGRDDLAREALRRKRAEMQDLDDLEADIDELESAQQTLLERRDDLERRIERFRTEREQLKARRKAAEADLTVSETMADTGEDGGLSEADTAIGDVADRTAELEARTAALEELDEQDALGRTGVFGDEDDIEAELDRIQTDDEIESELALLRDELGETTDDTESAGAGATGEADDAGDEESGDSA